MTTPSTIPRSAISGRTAILARLSYACIVMIATLSDLDFDPSTAAVSFRLARAFTLSLHMSDAVDGARNMVLFAGLGAVWVVTSRSGRILRSTVHVTLIGCALSVIVETLQLFSPVRNSSIIDITTNTLGALFGAIVIDLIILWVHRKKSRKSFVGMPAFAFATAYGICVLAETFAPLFRQQMLPEIGDTVRDRIATAWHAITLSSITHIPGFDLFLFFPAGVFGVAALAEEGIGYGIAWPLIAVLGTTLCILTEIFHGVVHQPIELGAILTHAIAISAGAAAAAHWLPRFSTQLRGARRPRSLLIAYAAIIAIWSWRPFLPDFTVDAMREQFSAMHWIPLRALAVRFDLFTVTDVMTQFLLYLPLGALLAVWPLRTRGPWRHLYPAIYLSIVMELGKIVIADRFFDITHIMIQVAGALMGWVILRRSGFNPYGEVWAS